MSSSTTREIDGKVVDRDLLEIAHHAVGGKSGKISKASALKVLESYAKKKKQGHSVKHLENAIRHVLGNYSCTNPARSLLEDKVGAVTYNPHNGYYVHVDGENFDRSLYELAQKLSRDRHISKADAEKLWEDALDGHRVTAIEKATLEYIMANFNATPSAKAYLKEQIAGLDSHGKPHPKAVAVQAQKEAASAPEPVDATPAAPCLEPVCKWSEVKETEKWKDETFKPTIPLLQSPKSPFQHVVKALNTKDGYKSLTSRAIARALCRVVVSAAEEDQREEAMQSMADLLSHDKVETNPPSADSDEMGPLHLAAKLDLPKVAKALLDSGASLACKSLAQTPLEIAQEKGNSEVMAAMLDHIKLLEAKSRGDVGLFSSQPQASKRKRDASSFNRKRSRKN